MPAAQLLSWMEYERLEPFGSWRDNYHAAMVAHILASAFRDPKRPPPMLHDFFYRDPETASEENDAELLAFLDAHSKKD